MTLLIYNTIKCLYLSMKIRPYLSLKIIRDAPLREPNACSLLPHGMVVEPSPHQSLAADLRLLQHLGFNHMSSN